jgi:enamine deaminase RidA (YjgF/YER057c/UK114 family)
MAMIESRNPEDVHPPLAAYSHQIELTGNVRWLVLAGQVGRTVDGTVPEDSVEQLAVAMDNVRRNLHAAGMVLDDLVKLTVYVVGDVEIERFRETMASLLEGRRPCMTLLYVAGLANPAFRFELDAWAATSD